MIEIKSADQLKKAIERAQAGKLFVQPTSMSRQYRVTNRATGAQYTVDFFLRNRKRFGHCTCRGGERNLPCKHLAASLGLHLCVASARYSETSH